MKIQNLFSTLYTITRNNGTPVYAIWGAEHLDIATIYIQHTRWKNYQPVKDQGKWIKKALKTLTRQEDCFEIWTFEQGIAWKNKKQCNHQPIHQSPSRDIPFLLPRKDGYYPVHPFTTAHQAMAQQDQGGVVSLVPLPSMHNLHYAMMIKNNTASLWRHYSNDVGHQCDGCWTIP